MTWLMWAEPVDPPIDGREWMRCHASRRYVVAMGCADPVRVLVLEDPDGVNWGFIKADREGPDFIQPHRGMFSMQFPYGPEAEEERGHGRIVRLSIVAADDGHALIEEPADLQPFDRIPTIAAVTECGALTVLGVAAVDLVDDDPAWSRVYVDVTPDNGDPRWDRDRLAEAAGAEDWQWLGSSPIQRYRLGFHPDTELTILRNRAL